MNRAGLEASIARYDAKLWLTEQASSRQNHPVRIHHVHIVASPCDRTMQGNVSIAEQIGTEGQSTAAHWVELTGGAVRKICFHENKRGTGVFVNFYSFSGSNVEVMLCGAGGPRVLTGGSTPPAKPRSW